MIEPVRIAIVGFGLIGGSIARALRRREAAPTMGERIELVAWSRSPVGPNAALADGILDRAPETLSEALHGAELIVLAAPPLACLDLLAELAGPRRGEVANGATLSDVASTKRAIVARADEAGLRFVGGHPFAGRDAVGYEAAEADLFVDHPWVICPGRVAEAGDVGRVERLALACGARPVPLDPGTHDAAAATISHVPLVVSAALVEAMTGRPGWPIAASLAAGGWRDMTRLSRGDPDMGAGIGATNAAELAAGVRTVRDVLDEWLTELDPTEPDVDALRVRFEAARARLGS
jgi:prephenate dehydrogenase